MTFIRYYFIIIHYNVGGSVEMRIVRTIEWYNCRIEIALCLRLEHNSIIYNTKLQTVK